MKKLGKLKGLAVIVVDSNEKAYTALITKEQTQLLMNYLILLHEGNIKVLDEELPINLRNLSKEQRSAVSKK